MYLGSADLFMDGDLSFPQARPMKADVKDKSLPPRDREYFLGHDIQPLFVTAALSILQHYPE